MEPLSSPSFGITGGELSGPNELLLGSATTVAEASTKAAHRQLLHKTTNRGQTRNISKG